MGGSGWGRVLLEVSRLGLGKSVRGGVGGVLGTGGIRGVGRIVGGVRRRGGDDLEGRDMVAAGVGGSGGRVGGIGVGMMVGTHGWGFWRWCLWEAYELEKGC